MQVSELLALIAAYLGKTGASDLVINGEDLGKAGLNSARRKAEQAHDFKFAETNCFLSIGINGGTMTGASAVTPPVVTVTGTLTPDVTGSYTQYGMFNGRPLYMLIATAFYVIWYDTSMPAWVITTVTDFAQQTGYTDYFKLSSTSPSPAGTYSPQGTNTGGPVVSGGNVSVKRVKFVSLPVNGNYQPIEFLSNDQYISRIKRLIGRQPFNSGKNLQQLGASLISNPLCYQNGQTLYLIPSTLSLPITAQLSVVQWMPDYASGTDSDFFTIYGPEYLYWQGIIEVNKYWKRFTVRQEGDVEEDKVQAISDSALRSLIAWDSSIESGMNNARPSSELFPAPAAQPQEAA